MLYLNWILLCFEALSMYLKVNLEKSAIYPVGKVQNIHRVAKELGCTMRSVPITFLVLPLGTKHNNSMVWGGIEEKFRKKQATWKRQHIFKWGQLNLIRSTLSNLSIYFLSLFWMSRVVKRDQRKYKEIFCGEEVLKRGNFFLQRKRANKFHCSVYRKYTKKSKFQ